MRNNASPQKFLNIGRVLSRKTYKTRSHMALEIPLRKSKLAQKSISFIEPVLKNLGE